MLGLGFAASLWFFGGADAPVIVRVRGRTHCPTAAEVEARLVGMVAPEAGVEARDIVELSGEGTRVTIRLTTALGEAIAERQVPEAPSCAERARMAAVIVAAWEAHLHPGAQPTLPHIQRPEATRAPSRPPAPGSIAAVAPLELGAAQQASTVSDASPTPVLVPLPQPPPSLVPGSPPSPRPPVTAPVNAARGDETIGASALAEPGSSSPIDIETAAAAMASVAAGAIVPAVMVEARASLRGSSWAIAAGVVAVGTHAISVGSGQGTWRRFGGIVDLRSIARWRIVEVEMRGGVALTAVDVMGKSFAQTSGTTLFDPGVLVGLRSRLRLGRLSPWVEVTGAGWPGSHTLYVRGTNSDANLPPFELFLGLGVTLALNP